MASVWKYAVPLAFSLCVSAAGAVEPSVDQVVAAAANEALEHGPLPGLSVAVLRGDSPVYAGGFGLAEIDNRVRATDATVYRINSVTKAFTALAVLQLVQQGKLRLDDPLSRYFPEYTRPDRDPTLLQLLQHTSGMTNYGRPEFHRDIRLDLSAKSWVDSVNDAHLYGRAPGVGWSYSNVAYDLLGLIIEKVSGLAPADYFERNITSVAGMTSTRMCNTPEILPNRAYSYRSTPKGWVHAESWGTYGETSDRLCSTVVDLGRFWRALRGGQLLSPALVKEMDTGGSLAGHVPFGYGLGVRLGHLEGHPLIALTGSGEMWTSALVTSPEDDWTVIVLTNTEADRYSAAHVAVEILRSLAGLAGSPRDLPVEPRLAAQLAGVWGQDQPAELSASAGHIQMKILGAPIPPFDLQYSGQSDFRFGADSPAPGIELEFDTREPPFSAQIFADGIFQKLELKQSR